MDLIFQQWWYPMILNPFLYGLIKISADDQQFMTNLANILKILQAVLYSNNIEGEEEFAIEVNKFIESKKYISNLILI